MLDLWERAVGRDRWSREEALVAGSEKEDRTLGARNRSLLATRNALFGAHWPLRSTCPACRSECTFEVDSARLAEELAIQEAREPRTFEWSGRTISARPLTVDDLVAASRSEDVQAAARALLTRCLDTDQDLRLDEAD